MIYSLNLAEITILKYILCVEVIVLYIGIHLTFIDQKRVLPLNAEFQFRPPPETPQYDSAVMYGVPHGAKRRYSLGQL